MNTRIALIALLLSCSPSAVAQATATRPEAAKAPPQSQDPLHRESPRSSVYSFLEACHARNYAQASRYIDLRNAPPDQRSQNGPQLAQQLEQILDRDVRFDVASMSGNPEGDREGGLAPNRERVDSFRLNNQDVELDHVVLQSGLSVWLFSSDSIALIPQLAKLVSDSPIERHLPQPLVEWKLIDTPLWRWTALVLLAAVLLPLSRLVARPTLLLADGLCKRLAPKMDRSALQAFVGSLRLLLCIAVFRAGIEWIGPAALLRLDLQRVLTFLFFLALARICMAVVDVSISHLRGILLARHQAFSCSALPLARAS